jgi:hypothetical protein
MLMADHQKNNTLYCVHGRHASQSMDRLILSDPEFTRLHKLQDSVVMSDHFRGKMRIITRDPEEKFTSGLFWYLSRAQSILTGDPMWRHDPDYATTQRMLGSMMLSSAITSNFDLRFQNFDMWPQTEFILRFQNYSRDHFKYHLGEPHMGFNNLNMVCLVALGLDIEVIDVKNLNQAYEELGYFDKGQKAGGTYVSDDDKKSFYTDITKIYMDSLNTVAQTGIFNPSPEEFQELMHIETQAYNALNSDNMQADCKSFLLELLRGILDDRPYDPTNPKIEISYLLQSSPGIRNQSELIRLLPYQSELYPVVCLLTILMSEVTPDDWKCYLPQCESILASHS